MQPLEIHAHSDQELRPTLGASSAGVSERTVAHLCCSCLQSFALCASLFLFASCCSDLFVEQNNKGGSHLRKFWHAKATHSALTHQLISCRQVRLHPVALGDELQQKRRLATPCACRCLDVYFFTLRAMSGSFTVRMCWMNQI